MSEDNPKLTGSTSAQLRGDIQAGLTGDKQPGFDPAMAPLETDAEASGTTLNAQALDMERRHQRIGRRQEVPAAHGDAMRPILSGTPPLYPWFWPVILAALTTICIVMIAAALVLDR